MADKFAIDSHKLIYHPERVAKWMKCGGEWECLKSVYPIYMEISPFGACNHRCVFCAVDFVGYKSRQLDADIFKERLSEMAALGVRSLMFAGEGEPVLWRPLPDILDQCKAVGIDTALTTNMVLFGDKNVDNFMRNCSWVKTSINAGTRETYAKVHRTKESDFDRVLDNFRLCVESRRQNGYKCTVGAQMLLLPENAHEAFDFALRLRDIGIDYLVIKPYSQHHSSETRRYENIDYRPYLQLEEDLRGVNTDTFNVIFRARTMKKLLDEQRGYDRCSAVPFFWGYVMSDGCVYSCSAFLEDERFNLGNIHEKPFKEIWEGEKRRLNVELISGGGLDISECRQNCRMDEINRYLWALTHPGDHVNFI